MTTKLNNISDTTDILVFSDVPNILTVSEPNTGTKTQGTIEVTTVPTVSADGQYYLTIYGDTISNVKKAKDATGKRFYISDVQSTAASITNALRNCNNFMGAFTVWQSGATVHYQARELGDVDADVAGNCTFLLCQESGGTSTSSLAGGKVGVDVFVDGDFETNLAKNYYDSTVGFNVTPIISSIAQPDKLQSLSFNTFALLKNGTYASGSNLTVTATTGYKAMYSPDYLWMDVSQILLNSNITYSLYKDKINYSLLYSGSATTVTLKGYDSTSAVVTSYTQTISTGSTRIIPSSFTNIQTSGVSYYVLYTDENLENYKFNIIKPLKLAEGYTRVLWHNEVGGISFYDFTGSNSATTKTNNQVVDKGILNYYTQPENTYEKEAVYSKKIEDERLLTSHLLTKEEKYIFESLKRAKDVWLESGKHIILTDCNVVEDGSFNDIYLATIKYRYSYDYGD